MSSKSTSSPKTRNIPVRINLYGGPCAGKSTMGLKLASLLKENGLNTELVPELIKPKAYQGIQVTTMFDQFLLFVKQMKIEMEWYRSGIDVMVCESPLGLNLFYGSLLEEALKTKEECEFEEIFPSFFDMEDLFKTYEEANITYGYFLRRKDKPYNPAGRYQDVEAAKAIDSNMLEFISYPMFKDILMIDTGDCDTVISEVLSENAHLKKKFKDAERYTGNTRRTDTILVADYTAYGT